MDDPTSVARIRAVRRTTSHVAFVGQAEAAQLFSSLTRRDVTADLKNHESRLYLDFLHMLNVVTHNTAVGLEDLHCGCCGRRRPLCGGQACTRCPLLAAVLHDSLHKKGILKSEIIPKLWVEHDRGCSCSA